MVCSDLGGILGTRRGWGGGQGDEKLVEKWAGGRGLRLTVLGPQGTSQAGGWVRPLLLGGPLAIADGGPEHNHLTAETRLVFMMSE